MLTTLSCACIVQSMRWMDNCLMKWMYIAMEWSWWSLSVFKELLRMLRSSNSPESLLLTCLFSSSPCQPHRLKPTGDIVDELKLTCYEKKGPLSCTWSGMDCRRKREWYLIVIGLFLWKYVSAASARNFLETDFLVPELWTAYWHFVCILACHCPQRDTVLFRRPTVSGTYIFLEFTVHKAKCVWCLWYPPVFAHVFKKTSFPPPRFNVHFRRLHVWMFEFLDLAAPVLLQSPCKTQQCGDIEYEHNRHPETVGRTQNPFITSPQHAHSSKKWYKRRN